MQNLNDSLIDTNIKQNKNTLKCCKLIFFLICNGLSFTSGILLSKYLEIKIEIKDSDGSL